MKTEEQRFSYNRYSDLAELSQPDRELIEHSKRNTANAYAPYSKFLVSAIARLKNGELVTGTNQENASYPVGICAERVLLSAVSSLYPRQAIDTIAIVYHNAHGKSNKPVSPCGMCRQALLEYEQLSANPIRILLSGMEGDIFEIKKSSELLPLSFTPDDL